MKKELLSALLAASIVLTGCASGKKDRKSSEQTDEIETTVNDSLEQTENEEETEPVEETTAFVDPRTRIEVEDGSVPIVLDGMSADEIVEAVKTHTYIYDGDTMEDFSKRFALPPPNIDYRSLDFFYYDDYVNYISVVSFGSSPLDETTGEITITDRSTVMNEIHLQDGELGKEVYDKMIEAYSKSDIFQDVRPEDNEWYSTSSDFSISMNFYRDGSVCIHVTRFLVV